MGEVKAARSRNMRDENELQTRGPRTEENRLAFRPHIELRCLPRRRRPFASGLAAGSDLPQSPPTC